jgi:plasmid replication initiation protein
MPRYKAKKIYTVTKSNALNELRANNMTLQELRLLAVYLSKINPFDKDTAAVRFPIKEFHDIMEVDMKRLRPSYYENVAERMLHKVIKIPSKYGFEAFTLFKRVKYEQNKDTGEHYFEMIASEYAMPLLFELRGNFFRYKLWNALRLGGKNQLRMYEVLKQHEYRGYCIIPVQELRAQLGIEEQEYPAYSDFRRYVLELCKKAISESTDISYTYEVYKRGAKGKVLELKFIIYVKKDFMDQLALDDYVEVDDIIDAVPEPVAVAVTYWDIPEDELDEDDLTPRQKKLLFMRDAVGGKFTEQQMITLLDLMLDKVQDIARDDIKCFKYLRERYNHAKLTEERGDIRKSVFALTRSLIGTELGN